MLGLAAMIQRGLMAMAMEFCEVQDSNAASLGERSMLDDHFDLSDLLLKRHALRQLGLPLTVVAGKIGRVRLRGLSAVLTGGTITLEIEDVYLVVAPCGDAADPDAAIAVRRFWLACREKFKGPDARYRNYFLEAALRLKPNWRDKNARKTALRRRVQTYVTKKLVAGGQVTVRRLHVRIECAAAHGGSSAQKGLCDAAFGLQVPLLSVVNCAAADATFALDASGTPVTADPLKGAAASYVHKRLEIKGLQAYVDKGVASYTHAAAGGGGVGGTWDVFGDDWQREGRHLLVVRPLDITAAATVRQVEVKVPAGAAGKSKKNRLLFLPKALSCTCSALVTTLSTQQVVLVAQLASALAQRARQLRYARRVPRGSAAVRALPPAVLLPGANRDGAAPPSDQPEGSQGEVDKLLPHLAWPAEGGGGQLQVEVGGSGGAGGALEFMIGELGAGGRARNLWRYACACVRAHVRARSRDWAAELLRQVESHRPPPQQQQLRQRLSAAPAALRQAARYVSLFARTLPTHVTAPNAAVDLQRLAVPPLPLLSKREQLELADLDAALRTDQILFLRAGARVSAHLAATSSSSKGKAGGAQGRVAWPPEGLVALLHSLLLIRLARIEAKAAAKAAEAVDGVEEDAGGSTDDQGMDAMVMDYFSKDGQKLDKVQNEQFSDDESDDESVVESDDEAEQAGLMTDAESTPLAAAKTNAAPTQVAGLLGSMLQAARTYVIIEAASLELSAPPADGSASATPLLRGSVGTAALRLYGSTAQQVGWWEASVARAQAQCWQADVRHWHDLFAAGAAKGGDAQQQMLLLRLVFDPKRQLCPLFAPGGSHSVQVNASAPLAATGLSSPPLSNSSSSASGLAASRAGLLAQLRCHAVLGPWAVSLPADLTTNVISTWLNAPVDVRNGAALRGVRGGGSGGGGSGGGGGSSVAAAVCEALVALCSADLEPGLRTVYSPFTGPGKNKRVAEGSGETALAVTQWVISALHRAGVMPPLLQDMVQQADVEGVIVQLLHCMLPHDFDLKVRLPQAVVNVGATARSTIAAAETCASILGVRDAQQQGCVADDGGGAASEANSMPAALDDGLSMHLLVDSVGLDVCSSNATELWIQTNSSKCRLRATEQALRMVAGSLVGGTISLRHALAAAVELEQCSSE
ncbi:hypothetical protein JKP88DRAFT_337388 [Tribonema minus]|uniref:Uncharacterized protein n=1 Tax=Tribonema minus TaxID=303371 RepID=A0A836C8B3_9STRA|nr:hypothetical protein JKP88DRAFT_337388 [Tribonema minus]